MPQRHVDHEISNCRKIRVPVYLSRKVSFWLFKNFEIQKGRHFNFNDILRLCTIVVNIAIRSRA